MSEVRVRRAAAGDADVIVGIQAATAIVAYAHIFPGQPFPIDRTRRRWRTFDGQVLLAEIEGKAVGFVAWKGDELDALYVLPEAAGQGLGTRLLDEAGDVTALWVLEENDVGRRFYERRGWQPDGTAQVSFGVRELRYRRR